MAKFYGKIGYGMEVETTCGDWSPSILERDYYGDVLRNVHKYESGDSINSDLNIDNIISIVADHFAFEQFQNMRYVEYLGVKWKINRVEVQSPRLNLTIGGVYHGEEASSSQCT